MGTSEILLKQEDAKNFIASLPENGPFGEEILKNNEKSAIVSRIVTAENESPKAELHENYNDIFLIQEGKEELYIGGEIIDKKEISSGEWQGFSLEGARKYEIAAGDVVIIPKGLPHRHGKGKIKLFVIKTV